MRVSNKMRSTACHAATIKDLADGPDYLKAKTTLGEISKDFKGLPPGAEADAELDRFERDRTIKREITAMKNFEKLKKKYPLSKSSSRNKLGPAIQKFTKRYKGTYAVEKARKLQEQLRGR